MSSEKRVVLLIVEGNSDKTALELAINRYLAQNRLSNAFVCSAFASDFTIHRIEEPDTLMQDDDDPVDNIVAAIKKYINGRENTNKYKLSDIALVLSLSDFDCCYCKNDDVIVDTLPHSCVKKTYADLLNKKYICTDKPFILKRNLLKTNSLGILANQEKIKVDDYVFCYYAFYCSINLEHSLYNESGSFTEDQKNDKAQQFRLEVSNSPSLFYHRIESIPCIGKTYQDSWDETELFKRPFERFSNLKIMIDLIISFLKSL